MQTVSYGQNLHEMSNPIFLGVVREWGGGGGGAEGGIINFSAVAWSLEVQCFSTLVFQLGKKHLT